MTQRNGSTTEYEAAARLLYAMEGWDRYWPYEERPIWLREKYPRRRRTTGGDRTQTKPERQIP